MQEVASGGVTEFADLSTEVGCGKSGCLGERGLASIALAPDFDTSGRLFADYTSEPDGAIHVVELVAPLGGSAVGATPRQLLEIEHPVNANHNGGQLQFGPEGDLFISTGDGGGADDEMENAQDLKSLLGKILRIDPDPSGLGPVHGAAGQPVRREPPPPPTTRSGATACAIRSASPSTAPAVASGSATSARAPARRSTSAPRRASAPAPTTAGTASRGRCPGRRPTPAAPNSAPTWLPRSSSTPTPTPATAAPTAAP